MKKIRTVNSKESFVSSKWTDDKSSHEEIVLMLLEMFEFREEHILQPVWYKIVFGKENKVKIEIKWIINISFYEVLPFKSSTISHLHRALYCTNIALYYTTNYSVM